MVRISNRTWRRLWGEETRAVDAWARRLGRNDCASALPKTLDQEHMTEKKLTSRAEGRANLRAAS
ncbi:DUF892 family protein [Bradyrhizobium lablabi]|uniref:DUF892 family protein n=1 Tax=Bradyrhizobium lablabi TaxID=722472 RepID=UPI0009A8CAF8|nr:DUF892 family protein [Bradyrhizobium lablabi]